MNLDNQHILIVEDEIIATEYLKEILLSMGVKNIYTVNNAKEALEILQSNSADIIFMDININGPIDGITCAKEITYRYNTPIIFTTAYKDKQTIQEASETNIYGYLIKPFSQEDVFAAVSIVYKTVNKRDKTASTNKINLADYIYDTENKTIYENGIVINLTVKEELILSILTKNINQNTSYEELKQKIWDDKNISDSTIRDSVSRLRKKLPKLNIDNISGYGYVLKK